MRFISGTLRSTQTAACEIHTNVEPIHLRRQAAVVETTERYRKLDVNHPNRQLTEASRPAQRIEEKSILTLADSLKEKYHLPDNRESLTIFDEEHPPNIIIKPPTIKTSLIEVINNKDSGVAYLMNTAQKTVDRPLY